MKQPEKIDYGHYQWLVNILDLFFYDLRKARTRTEAHFQKFHNIIVMFLIFAILNTGFVWLLTHFII